MPLAQPKSENKVVQGLVSTIIPVHNRPRFLKEAVDSVLVQTYRRIEIIVVDDGSTDETSSVAESLCASHPAEIDVVHQQNKGPGGAREAGREIARGEFIQYLDSDDILLPRKFEIQVAALRKQPECDVAYGYARLVNEKGDVLAAPYKWTGRTFPTLFPWLLVDRWWNTHTPLYRRTLCDAVGPWTNMRMSEDWEYDARVGGLGAKLVHVREVLSDTRQHNTNRITGRSLNTSMLKDMTRLIDSLYRCARKVGISIDCPEMGHFSRWAFLLARQAGAAGLPGEARQCFKLAKLSAGPTRRKGFDFKVYELFANSLGNVLTGKLFCHLDKLVKCKPGASTMKQSWMGE